MSPSRPHSAPSPDEGQSCRTSVRSPRAALGASLETRRTDRRCRVNRPRVQPRRGIAPADRRKRPGIRNWSDERSSRRRRRESSGRLRRASQENERVRILAPTPSSRRPMSNCQRHPFVKGTETLDLAHGQPSIGSGLLSKGGSSMFFALVLPALAPSGRPCDRLVGRSAERHRGSRPSSSASRPQATGGPAATSPSGSAVPRSGEQGTPSSALVCLPGQPADPP
jgi:hypothetical protein